MKILLEFIKDWEIVLISYCSKDSWASFACFFKGFTAILIWERWWDWNGPLGTTSGAAWRTPDSAGLSPPTPSARRLSVAVKDKQTKQKVKRFHEILQLFAFLGEFLWVDSVQTVLPCILTKLSFIATKYLSNLPESLRIIIMLAVPGCYSETAAAWPLASGSTSASWTARPSGCRRPAGSASPRPARWAGCTSRPRWNSALPIAARSSPVDEWMNGLNKWMNMDNHTHVGMFRSGPLIELVDWGNQNENIEESKMGGAK